MEEVPHHILRRLPPHLKEASTTSNRCRPQEEAEVPTMVEAMVQALPTIWEEEAAVHVQQA